MRSHTFHIPHHGQWILEDLLIDTLKDITPTLPVLQFICSKVGRVDMSTLDLFSHYILPLDRKLICNPPDKDGSLLRERLDGGLVRHERPERCPQALTE